VTSASVVNADPSSAAGQRDPARRDRDGRLLNAKMVPKRRTKPSWWIGGAVLALLVIGFVTFLVTNENLRWSVVGTFLFDPRILSGLLMTLELTAVAMVGGLVIGVILAIMRLSGNPVFRAASWAWIWFFRGVPPLVQLVFWYNLALLLPRVEIGLPFGPTLASWNTNDLITPLSAAVLGLALTESAYAAGRARQPRRSGSPGVPPSGASSCPRRFGSSFRRSATTRFRC
jgi:polar amino acid transport system permease protein